MAVAFVILLLAGLICLGIIVALVALAVVVARPRRERARAAAAQLPGLCRLVRTQNVARGVALLAGIAITLPAAAAWTLGRGLMLAPAAFAAAQVVAVLIADRVSYDAVRSPGVAGLEVRRVRDYLPRGLTALTVLAAAALAAALTWTTAVASPDDLGRAGRALTYRCVDGCGLARISPWPGSFYSAPLAVGLGVVAALALAAVTITVRRPRNGADASVTVIDDAVRRRSVETVVAALGLAISASLTGVAMVAGLRLLADADVPSGGSLTTGAALLTFAGAGSCVVMLCCAVSLLLPGAGASPAPRPAPDQVGGRVS